MQNNTRREQNCSTGKNVQTQCFHDRPPEDNTITRALPTMKTSAMPAQRAHAPAPSVIPARIPCSSPSLAMPAGTTRSPHSPSPTGAPCTPTGSCSNLLSSKGSSARLGWSSARQLARRDYILTSWAYPPKQLLTNPPKQIWSRSPSAAHLRSGRRGLANWPAPCAVASRRPRGAPPWTPRASAARRAERQPDSSRAAPRSRCAPPRRRGARARRPPGAPAGRPAPSPARQPCREPSSRGCPRALQRRLANRGSRARSRQRGSRAGPASA
mmetsp:Transcript_69911/g.187601  ORF Transcript_69911/g.187601 Transcript_69911/m.187601 type:complete len:270 (-) Transcript_69911:230-1039(-)